MADLSPLPTALPSALPSAMSSPALATASLAAPHARGWWDTILALMVMALANFWEALPHLIQLGGLVVVCLTAVQKLIELGWIKNPRARKQEAPDDAG